MKTIRLGQIAYARSGDKGSSANIGVIARTPPGYIFLRDAMSAQKIECFFKGFAISQVLRYELPNLGALNFVLHGVLDGGGSVSLRIDAQGKALGQLLLEMNLDVPDDVLPSLLSVRTSWARTS